MSPPPSRALSFLPSAYEEGAMAGTKGASAPPPFLSLSLLLIWLVSFNLVGNAMLGQAQKTWCVAKPSTDDATLQQNIDFACSQVDCGILRNGCPCFYPTTRINRASVAMNLYYQSKGRNYWNCHFNASGLIVQTDPSYSNCVYM